MEHVKCFVYNYLLKSKTKTPLTRSKQVLCSREPTDLINEWEKILGQNKENDGKQNFSNKFSADIHSWESATLLK